MLMSLALFDDSASMTLSTSSYASSLSVSIWTSEALISSSARSSSSRSMLIELIGVGIGVESMHWPTISSVGYSFKFTLTSVLTSFGELCVRSNTGSLKLLDTEVVCRVIIRVPVPFASWIKLAGVFTWVSFTSVDFDNCNSCWWCATFEQNLSNPWMRSMHSQQTVRGKESSSFICDGKKLHDNSQLIWICVQLSRLPQCTSIFLFGYEPPNATHLLRFR